MLARSASWTPRWLPSANLRPPIVQHEYEVNRFRREPQASASGRATADGGIEPEEMPDGTLVYTFGDSSDAPKRSSQKAQEEAPGSSVPHVTGAEPAVDRSTALNDNGTGTSHATLQPAHEEGTMAQEAAEGAGDTGTEVPSADLRSSVATSLEQYTVRQLHQACKDRGLKGYSALNKARVIEMLAEDDVRVDSQMANVVAFSEEDDSDFDGPSDLEADFDFESDDVGSLTVKQLKRACKEKGLKGYTNLRKKELVELLSGE